MIVAELFKFGALYLMVTSEPACTEVGADVKPRPLDWAAARAADAAKVTKLKKRMFGVTVAVHDRGMRFSRTFEIDYATAIAR